MSDFIVLTSAVLSEWHGLACLPELPYWAVRPRTEGALPVLSLLDLPHLAQHWGAGQQTLNE